jgi:energy-coupling factor transporter ATP-binding protein EcfA2
MSTVGLVRITSIQFSRFKAFSNYTISLDRINILVGPNNSGKSTIIGALRALASGLRIARTQSPQRIEVGTHHRTAYRIPESSLPISLENVHTDYDSTESKVTFNLSNKNKLHLVFPSDGGCFLIPENQGRDVNSVAAFKKNFPITITCVPVLGPVEHREQRRERSTVVAGLTTHRASRHFRNYWHYFDEGFDDFADLIRTTWPGMEIRRPEIVDAMTGELSMFCLEGRMSRELYWVGFGFQVWCQLLTHLSRAGESTILVIDEPEAYLHPDIQRQLIALLREAGPDVLLATHSTEIMSEADPNEIVLIDKQKSSGERLKDITGLQRALDAVGSIQNITLTALAKNRRVLFVEGDNDFRLLRRFARKLGMSELAAGMGITALESGGFGSWQRVTILAAGIAEALGSALAIAAVYDRDYFCEEEIAFVSSTLNTQLKLAHVHQRKEIENYLLVPAALDRAIARALSERAVRMGIAPITVLSTSELFREITDSLKDEVQSQIIARRTNYLLKNRKDIADITRDALAWFTPRWNDINKRVSLVPGKAVLSLMRERIQTTLGISITQAQIVEAMHKDEIPNDLMQLLRALDEYRRIVV